MRTKTPGVLYIDDEKKALKYFERLFQDKYKIYTAPSAEEGMAILKKYPKRVSVICADQRMPKTTGVEMLEQARAYRPEISRVLITAYSELDSAIRAINSGQVFRFVQKPWELPAMAEVLEESIAHNETMARMAEIQNGFFNDLMTGKQFKAYITSDSYKPAKRKFLDFFEECYIRNALLNHNGNVSRTAETTGINRRTIQRILKRITEDDKLNHIDRKLRKKVRRYYQE